MKSGLGVSESDSVHKRISGVGSIYGVKSQGVPRFAWNDAVAETLGFAKDAGKPFRSRVNDIGP